MKYQRLKRSFIRQLKPGERITEKGITAERTKKGDIKFSVNFMSDGQRIHRVIGLESEGVTRTQAEEFVAAKRTDAREGRLQLPHRRKTHLSFRQVADKYLKRLEEIGGKNLKVKKRHIIKTLTPFFADQRLDKISAFTIDRYKARRSKEGVSDGTINRELATLSHIFNKALEWSWIQKKPAKVTKLQEPEGRIIALSDSQAEDLIDAAIKGAEPDLWLFVVMALNTSMRHSEILSARWEDLDAERLRLHVPKAKSGMREQPITQELADILESEHEMREDQEGWIFPSPRPNASKTGHRHRMDKPFRRAVVLAGLDPQRVTPHVLRHTAITKLVESGVDLATVQKISGHKTLSMVMRYAHIHGTHIDRAMTHLSRTVPERSKNKNADTTTPKLHMFSKKRV